MIIKVRTFVVFFNNCFHFSKIYLFFIYFVLSINLLLFIISFIAYKITFFHGYQVSLDKTLNILQSNSSNGELIDSKKD